MTPHINFISSVGLLLLALMDCIVYSTNWIAGSLSFLAGIGVWVALIMLKSLDRISTLGAAVSSSNFCVGLWVVPFLLYWSEKRARHDIFVQWCQLKVY